MTWRHAMQVGDMGSGDLVVLAGTSTGNVSRLRLQAPLAPGADPSGVQVYILLMTCSYNGHQATDAGVVNLQAQQPLWHGLLQSIIVLQAWQQSGR